MTGRAFASKIWPWGAAALSGLLLALCYPGHDVHQLAWVALTPLIAALWFAPDNGKKRWLKKAGLGFCTGVVFFCITFSWLTTVTGLMQPHFLGALALFGLDCYLALYFALWGWFMGCVIFRADRDSTRLLGSRFNLWLGISCGAAWAAQEWLRNVIFTGFGWNPVGVALHNVIALIQIADITGVYGLSFLVVMCNAMIVVTIRRFALEIQSRKLRPHFDFTLTLTLVGLVFAYGVHKLTAKPGASIPLEVACVQANIPQTEKFNYEYEDRIFAQYQKWTDIAIASKPRLIIWPEAATPRGAFADETNYQFVMGFVKKTDANFLLGTIDSEGEKDYNIAALFASGGGEPQFYRKIHLVPFGEYIPARESFPLFAKLAGELVGSDFSRGTEHNVLQMENPSIKIGALICFEDTDGDLTRHFALNGAQLLVNLTNDGWFLKSVESKQHLANAVFRAIESRRPLIRCTNTGMTCFVDSFGRVGQTLVNRKGEPFIEGILRGQVNVPENGEMTFYAQHGEWFPVGSLILAAGTVAAHFWRRRRAKK